MRSLIFLNFFFRSSYDGYLTNMKCSEEEDDPCIFFTLYSGAATERSVEDRHRFHNESLQMSVRFCVFVCLFVFFFLADFQSRRIQVDRKKKKKKCT